MTKKDKARQDAAAERELVGRPERVSGRAVVWWDGGWRSCEIREGLVVKGSLTLARATMEEASRDGFMAGYVERYGTTSE